jgi:triosephosphate isomerase
MRVQYGGSVTRDHGPELISSATWTGSWWEGRASDAATFAAIVRGAAPGTAKRHRADGPAPSRCLLAS